MRKNIRTVPIQIREKLKRLKGKSVVAGCARGYPRSDIENGALKHLGITLTADGLHHPKRIIPPSSQGKYSSINRNGEEIVRRDLPMETHYNRVETPNWETLQRDPRR